MTQDKNSIQTPIAKVKGLGAAKNGTEHWLYQRISSIASFFLSLWFVWSMVHTAGAAYAEMYSWLAYPVNAVLMILFVITAFFHAALGAQVIVEDYIHCEAFKMIKLIGIKLFYSATVVVSIFAILEVAFG